MRFSATKHEKYPTYPMAMPLEDAIVAKPPQLVFTYDDGTQPLGFEGTFRRLLAAADLSKDMSSRQQRTMYSLRHTYPKDLSHPMLSRL